MREIPMLFSVAMVRAILDGKKTMTRRVIKPQADSYIGDLLGQPFIYPVNKNGDADPTNGIRVRYSPGDRIWVRETWANVSCIETIKEYTYRADYSPNDIVDFKYEGSKWRPSIFMPREACRITLIVTDVKAQRLQNISEDDAKAEGVKAKTWYRPYRGNELNEIDISGLPGFPDERTSYRNGFATLWDSINAERGYGWAENPWVWAITFIVD